ncbi:MAG TPA: methionyl-tRNA formyltransferase [Candidatus Saccharimonadales bacterium]
MQPKSRTIVFFGTEDFSAASLEALLAADYSIAAVVTKPDSKRGRGRTLTAPPVKRIAEAHSIPVWQPQKLAEILPNLQRLVNPVGVLVSYGKIIPSSIIECFSPGIINVHPSLLPKYRGPSPIESAILHGDSSTGISIMQLTKAMDAGPVYAQKEYSLNGSETGVDLYKKFAQEGAKLLLATLPDILSGTPPKPQDSAAATYCPLLTKQDGQLSPDNLTASECERRVRAFLLFPKARLSLYGHECIILKAHTQKNSPTTELGVQCKDNQYLIIDELIAPSGKRMSSPAFMRGYALGQ